MRQLWRNVYPDTTHALDIHSADQPLCANGLTLDIAGSRSELDRLSDGIPASARFRRITDLQMRYLSADALHVERMGRGFAWLDTGTVESLIDAGTFVQTLEKRQGMKIACLEEVAFRLGFINRDQLLALAESLQKSGYGRYLNEILRFHR